MSKELFCEQRETEVLAKMSEYDYLRIDPDIRATMSLKSIDVPNWREVYQEDKEWQELNKTFIEALKARKLREDEIRASNK
jgi:hypothetical protein